MHFGDKRTVIQLVNLPPSRLHSLSATTASVSKFNKLTVLQKHGHLFRGTANYPPLSFLIKLCFGGNSYASIFGV